jgi:hypothetical protein
MTSPSSHPTVPHPSVVTAEQDGRNRQAASPTKPVAPRVVIGLIACAIVFFQVLIHFGGIMRGANIVSIASILLLTATGAVWKRRDLPAPFYIVAVVINVDAMVYLAGSAATYTLGCDNRLLDSVWLPLGLGIYGFLRPAFLIFPVLAMQWSKNALATQVGTLLAGPSDYIIVLDLALIMLCCMALFAIARRTMDCTIPGDWLRRRGWRLDSGEFFCGCVIAMAGIHLSNYFYSGWEKLILPNASWLTWVLENPTYLLAVHARDFELLTIQTLLPVGDRFFHLLRALNVPMNVLVLGAQLAAVGVLLSLRASSLLTAFFDLMHLAIFALTAIFFWKWILLNIGFVLAFEMLKREVRFAPPAIRLMGCALVIAAPALSFHIVRLGWFDSPGVTEVHFEAETLTGEKVRVPSNFFLGHSLDVAYQRFAHAFPGYLPTGPWGTTSDGAIFHQMMSDCTAESNEWTLPEAARNQAQRLVMHYHAQALALSTDGSGRFHYDRYPHHIWSSPWSFEQFGALDLRTIRAYVLVVESRCVSVDRGGRISRTLLKRSRYELPL